VVIEVHAQVLRLERRVQRGGRHIGSAPDVARIDLEQQLGHGGVAGQGDRGDVLRVHPRAVDDLAQNRVDGRDHHLLDAVQPARLFRVDDPRDHVLAVADLPVEFRVLGQHRTGDEVDHLAVDRGGADVHRDGTAAAGGVAGLDVDDAGLAHLPHRPHQCRGHLEVGLPHHLRELADDGQVRLQPVLVVLAPELADQTAHVRQVVLG